jgi:hypothetical protein
VAGLAEKHPAPGSSPHSCHVFDFPFIPAHVLQSLSVQQLPVTALIFIVLALQLAQLLKLLAQGPLDFQALLLQAIALQADHLDLAPDDSLTPQQRLQLRAVHHTGLRTMTVQQAEQRSGVLIEAGAPGKQGLQLLLDVAHCLFVTLLA